MITPDKKNSGFLFRKVDSQEFQANEPLRLTDHNQSEERKTLVLKKSSIEISDIDVKKEAEDSKRFDIAATTSLKVNMRRQRLKVFKVKVLGVNETNEVGEEHGVCDVSSSNKSAQLSQAKYPGYSSVKKHGVAVKQGSVLIGDVRKINMAVKKKASGDS